MKSMKWVLMASVLLGIATFTQPAEAGDKHGRGQGTSSRRSGREWGRHDGGRDHRDRDWDRREVREAYYGGPYFRQRDVYVIRDYYRPYYRPLPPGLAKKYYRRAYLPPGWGHRIRPIPVYLDRDLVVLPRGYHRGIIDGRAVVYDGRGMIIDVAVLF